MIINNLEYLMFTLSSGCISDCKGCSTFVNMNDLFNPDIITNNLLECNSKGIGARNIMFFNYDIFNLDIDYINKLTTISFNNYTFHTEFIDIKSEHINIIKEKNISLIYQKNLNKNSLTRFFKSINNVSNIDVSYIYWVDNISDNKLIKYFISKLNILSFTEVSSAEYILGKVKIKFFEYNGSRVKLDKCYFDSGIEIFNNEININNNIFFPSYFEITYNGDIKVHEPPCGYGNLVISNIYRTKDDIVKDFLKFKNYIAQINLNNSKERCNNCNSKNYTYDK